MAFELIDLKPGQNAISASLKRPIQAGAGTAAAWLLLNGFHGTDIVTADSGVSDHWCRSTLTTNGTLCWL